MMKKCRFGVIFFGLGLTMTRGKHMNVDAALRLTRDLNDYTKFTIIPMRGHFNVSGADETSLWQTGYPFAVNFLRGYPVYNPGEFSAVDVLARGECDAALIIAADPVANFPIGASKHLAKIPTIVMDPKVNMTSMVAEVVIPTAAAGVECEGTAYRMDSVPIRLRKVVEPRYPPDKEILGRMIAGLKN
jgi:formylmethanofuran dehydrogenase subunit B